MPLHQASCHCGRNRFELDLPGLPTQALTCGCSLCVKKGMLWWPYTPGTTDFAILAGFNEEHGDVTTFRTPHVEYSFCASCGTGLSGYHLTGGLLQSPSANMRPLLDLNPFNIIPNVHGTRAVIPVGRDRAFAQATIGNSLLSGSCCCGAINIQLTGPPLTETEIKEDNCSICTRNAFIGLYPTKARVVITASENMTNVYRFGRGFNGHAFCRVCGVQTHQVLYGPPEAVVARLSPEKQAFVREQLAIQPVNVRCFDNVDIANLVVLRSDEGQAGYSIRPESSE